MSNLTRIEPVLT